MGIFKYLTKKLKGGRNAQGTGEPVFRGRGGERRILHSIQTVCEQALSDCRDIGMLARTYAAERGRDSRSMPTDSIRHESRALIDAAKRIGCFVDRAAVPGTRYTIRSGESEVRLVQRDGLYYKIKNPFAKQNLKQHPAEYMLFEHVVHNILFPDCRLEFLGVAEDFHEARLVFRQAAVRADERPDEKMIEHDLLERGLLPEGRYGFGNEYVRVTDVGQDGDNVLLDDAGILRFIDPIIGFKPPLLAKLADASDLAARIDQLVYKLYGLTEDEIAVVEGTGEKEPPVPKSVRPRRIAKPAEVVQVEENDEELE